MDDNVPTYPPVQFFGKRWDAPRVDPPAIQVPTPVGQKCLHCAEPIKDGDRGVFMAIARLDDDGKTMGSIEPAHLECDLRSVMGGIGHLHGSCSCRGGHGDPDEGLDYRESARLVLAEVEKLRGKPL